MCIENEELCIKSDKFCRDTSYSGHSFDSFYYHLGVMGFEVELGIAENIVMNGAESIDLRSGGINGEDETLDFTRRLMKHWDYTGQKEPLFVDWQAFDHPQLGKVEIGGLMETMHMNPLMETMGPIMEGCHASILHHAKHHAKHHPAVQVESLEVEPSGDSTYRERATITNRGLLSSHVTSKGRELGRFAPVMASLRPAPGVQLISQKGHLDLGHLQGVSKTDKFFINNKEL